MHRILVTDDDEGIRDVLYHLLTREGFQVCLACDGQEALDILTREGSWIILLDWMMPQVDGAEVLQYLRTHPSLLKENVVILMTASFGFKEEDLLLMAEVAAGMVSKPFELEEVLALVRRAGGANA